MKSIIKVLGIAAMCLCIGLSVAYYNTSSLGYDNANFISYNNNEIRIFDISIKYKEFFEKIEKSKEYIPTEFISI